jgi:hypothetical protein
MSSRVAEIPSLWRDISGQQRQGAQLRDGFAGGVGVDARHARHAGVEGDQQIQAFGLADFADDDTQRSHPQRLGDKLP